MTEAQRLAEWLDIFSHQTMHPLPITKAAEELRRLEAECEQLRADAARYQWLRSSKFIWSDFAYIRGFDRKVVGIEFQWFETDAKKPNKEDLDAAIDAAMKETK